MPHGTLGAAVNQDQPISTLVRQRQSQRLGDGRLALSCSDLARRLGAEADARVLREARSFRSEAHGPHGLLASLLVDGVLASTGVDGVWPFTARAWVLQVEVLRSCAGPWSGSTGVSGLPLVQRWLSTGVNGLPYRAAEPLFGSL